jgi:hypothetical protein
MLISDHLETTEVDLEPENDTWFPANAAVAQEEIARNRGAWFAFVSYRPRAT